MKQSTSVYSTIVYLSSVHLNVGGKMRQFLIGSLLLLLSGLSYGLSPAVEADRFMLAAKQYLNESNYVEAEKYLDRIGKLQVEPPIDYYYAFGVVYNKQDNIFDAKKFFEQYVEKAGSEGEFYIDALKAINALEVEKDKPKPVTVEPKIDWSQAAAAMKVESGYVKDLRDLYLTESSEEALELHLNSLLSVYHVGNGPNLKTNKRVSYVTSISISGDHIVSSVSNLDSVSKKKFVTSSRFSVFGVNPYVTSGCNSTELSCWVSHPQDGSQWIRIIHDSDAAKQIVKAVTFLIKEMQKN